MKYGFLFVVLGAMLLFIGSRAALKFGTPFEQSIKIAIDDTTAITLIVGQAENASDVFQVGEDTPAPPAPPNGFDARIVNDSSSLVTELYKDIRSVRDSAVFRFKIRPDDTSSNGLVLTWGDIPDFSDELMLDIAGETVDVSRSGSLSLSLSGTDFVSGSIRYNRFVTTSVDLNDRELPGEFISILDIQTPLIHQLRSLMGCLRPLLFSFLSMMGWAVS